MPTTILKKLGVRPGARSIIIGAPDDAVDAIDPGDLDLANDPNGELDYIHLFVTSADELDERFPRLKARLTAGGMLWVSWPKGGQLDTDLRLPRVIEIGYRHRLVESKCISINSTWSALKFTHPKPGKTYQNSFGRLPSS